MKIFKTHQTYLLFISILSLILLAGCGGGDNATGHWDGEGTPGNPLVSIAVTPATATVQIGNTRAFMATGTYSDGTTGVSTTMTGFDDCTGDVYTETPLNNAFGHRDIPPGIS